MRWNSERTTILDLLIIAASVLGGLVCLWLAAECQPYSESHDFLALTAVVMFALGAVLNLIPLTVTEGTRKRPASLCGRTAGSSSICCG